MNHIDTAQFYGDGLVNDLLRGAPARGPQRAARRGSARRDRAEQRGTVDGALGGALPGARRVVDEPAVRAAADEAGATPSQVGLAWLLHRGPNVLLIAGTASVEHLEINIDVASLRLGAASLAGLDAG
ncbi:aldo/keto reductase [Pseudonocardia nantongensis]|uniref:aldo/keto reductase n=1 Tax=Pseudonocardia nantongensis TaxID=1181885 RepID=UPI00397D64A8